MMKKKILIGIILCIILLTGCNKQIFDTNYSFNLVRCNYDGEIFERYIDKWNDYEGEQIQILTKDKVYLVSTNKCYLVGDR